MQITRIALILNNHCANVTPLDFCSCIRVNKAVFELLWSTLELMSFHLKAGGEKSEGHYLLVSECLT